MSILEYSEIPTRWGRSSWKNVHNCKQCPYFTTSLFLMVNHVRRHSSPLEKLNCEHASIEVYYCKDCDFKTELTTLFKRHINERHGLKTEFREDLSSQDFQINNYVCEKCDFETNFLLKWLQHLSTCTKKRKRANSYFKQTDEICWYYCAECFYKTKFKNNLRRHIDERHLNSGIRATSVHLRVHVK